MDGTAIVALIGLAGTAITAVLIPLAKWIFKLSDDKNKAEAELAYYKRDVPKAAEELRRSADTIRRQRRPVPYASLLKRRNGPSRRRPGGR